MKIGDLVTYKQRADLQQFPCPWERLGIIVGIEGGRLKEMPPRCEVHWYGSGNVVWWVESQLEIVR